MAHYLLTQDPNLQVKFSLGPRAIHTKELLVDGALQGIIITMVEFKHL